MIAAIVSKEPLKVPVNSDNSPAATGATICSQPVAQGQPCHRSAPDMYFACVKYISDGGDSNAAADWKDSIKKISSEFDVFLREKFE